MTFRAFCLALITAWTSAGCGSSGSSGTTPGDTGVDADPTPVQSGAKTDDSCAQATAG